MSVALSKALLQSAMATKRAYGNAQAELVMERLLHATRQHSAALARIEVGLERLGTAGLHVGLAHLDDANAPDRSEAERHRFLESARESFKEAAHTASAPSLRTTSALLCAICWVATERMLDGARWFLRAVSIAEEGLSASLKGQAPESPPPCNLRERLSRWFEGGEHPERLKWFEERYTLLEELLSLRRLALDFAACLGSAANHGSLILHPPREVDGWKEPWLYEDAGRAPFPAGTALLTVTGAIWHRWWPETSQGTLEVRFDVHRAGKLFGSDFGLTAPAGCKAWARTMSGIPYVTPRMDTAELGDGFSPGGLTFRTHFDGEQVSRSYTLLFDTWEVPPPELVLLHLGRGSRMTGQFNTWVPIEWSMGSTYLSMEPTPKEEHEPWDPRRDPLGWG